MNLIAAVDSNWGIGNKGQLLVSIPNDHKMFRQMTEGKVIVLGRKTLDTFPQGMPLPNRINIVLSKSQELKIKGAVVVHSIEGLLKELKKYDGGDIYIVGGASVYEQLLPYCDTAHITRIDHTYEADRYFPDLDHNKEWKITADSDEMTYFDIAYEFIKYERMSAYAPDDALV